MPSPEKERAADESENNAKQASGIWVRFVGTPDSGSFGRNQTPPQSLPKWVCFFESPTQRDAMTEHPYQTHVAGIAVPMDCGFLVIGAAVAGLRAAIELAKSGTVLVGGQTLAARVVSEYTGSERLGFGFVWQKPDSAATAPEMASFFRILNSTPRHDQTSNSNPRC